MPPTTSANSQIDSNFAPPTIETTGEYPQAQPNAVAVHPQTFQPLLNNGVGDDAGKVGKHDDNTVEAGTESSTSSSSSSDASQAAPSDTFGGGWQDDQSTGLSGGASFGGDFGGGEESDGKLDKLLSKVSHLEHMIKKLLHRNH